MNKIVNITVPTFNRLELTRRTLYSIKKFTRTPHTLTVVDNGSTDGTPEFLTKLKENGLIDNLILFRKNMGVSCAANMGFDIATPLYIKLDNDMEVVKENWLEPIVSLWRDNPEVALIGPKFPNSRHAFDSVILKSGTRTLRALTSLSGAALIVSRSAFNALGYFNEDYGLYGEEDADYSHRAKAAGILLAAFESRGIVNHLGDWSAGQQTYVNFKKIQRCKNTFSKPGINIFQLNCYLYNHGLLAPFVPRKYMPFRVEGYYWNVTLDKTYIKRSLYVRQCKKLLDDIPEVLWGNVINSDNFLSVLRDIKSRMGV